MIRTYSMLCIIGHNNVCVGSKRGCDVNPILFSTAISQSPDDCIESIDTNINNLLYSVPSGTLCVDCVIDDVRVTDFEFRVNNRELMAPNEIVVNDTLIILDTSIVFSDVLTPVRCSDNDVTAQIFVTLQGEALSYLLPLSSGLIH